MTDPICLPHKETFASSPARASSPLERRCSRQEDEPADTRVSAQGCVCLCKAVYRGSQGSPNPDPLPQGAAARASEAAVDGRDKPNLDGG